MSRPPITLIATIAGEDRVLSQNGKLPWKLREEKAHFSSLVAGQPVIIGRKAFEAEVRNLSKSFVIVLTRNALFAHEGASVAYSPEDAVQKAPTRREGDKVFVVGGRETFDAFLPLADEIELCVIHKDIKGDLFFPEIPDFEVVAEDSLERGRALLSFITLQRKQDVD